MENVININAILKEQFPKRKCADKFKFVHILIHKIKIFLKVLEYLKLIYSQVFYTNVFILSKIYVAIYCT